MYTWAMRPEGPEPLPPLAALRAFEVAARHLSFTRAAEELSVSQTAVSHHVRTLEDFLGVSLFRRLPRKVELTSEGRAWAAAASEGFGKLYEANRTLRKAKPRSRPSVSVTIIPSFASRWLVPRLGRFLELHPNVDVRISPSSELVDLPASNMDLGIRYGSIHRFPGLSSELLYADSWVVVCSPQLRGLRGLRTVQDLSRFVLLRDDTEGVWRTWFGARGCASEPGDRGALMDDSSMLVEACVRGHGVGMARFSLAAEDLASGRLVRPFPRIKPMATGGVYSIVWQRSRSLRPEVAAFRDWVLAEARTLPR
jgi:LysR family transcriptional regulator, glycine cleavage system transcriptional activator